MGRSSLSNRWHRTPLLGWQTEQQEFVFHQHCRNEKQANWLQSRWLSNDTRGLMAPLPPIALTDGAPPFSSPLRMFQFNQCIVFFFNACLIFAIASTADYRSHKQSRHIPFTRCVCVCVHVMSPPRCLNGTVQPSLSNSQWLSRPINLTVKVELRDPYK